MVFVGLTDSYSRTARLLPALLVALPITVTTLVAVPAAASLWGRVGGLIVASGAPVLATQIVRDRGRRVQEELFSLWGGPPTTLFLRWSGPEPRAVVARRHELIARITGRQLPNDIEEAHDSTAADEAYAVATTTIRELTRDEKQFPLVLKENITYGFHRNLLGCRVIGVGATLLSATVTTLLIVAHTGLPVPSALGLLLFDVICLLAWWRVVSRDWVRRAADIYAHRLFDAMEMITISRDQ